MTNTLVGDVYLKIIEEVVAASQADFEESGVGSQTLGELQQEWQNKLSQRGVAQMPWDPKPQPPQPPQQQIAPTNPGGNGNGMPANPYASYDASQAASNGQRVKAEPGMEHQYHGLPNGNYGQNNGQPIPVQGGAARAQQLVQQQFGNAAAPSLAAMQRGGLALPGQQQQQPKPQPMQLPQGSPAQQQFQQAQQAAMAQQQQRLHQQQAQPRIKVENDSPQLQQGQFQHPNYPQTDGANEEDDMAQWRAMLAERRAAHAQHAHQADRMMRDQVLSLTADLSNGLMVPLGEQPSSRIKNKKRPTAASAAGPSIPQLDGDEDEDEDKGVKDEDDPDAINSDLDDDDDDGQGAMGDEDDDLGDSILCTYDKVQRVKNKWKCTLKDGVMSVSGKEWVFHKGMGEFEW
ncbi:hypothetical protein CBER1_11799 [Cercospora berteroae]|uniref:Uncharacterized protein n=1 Tax=Cercospora berteroae TaxID=357750 RepID=A0A2S6C0A3_9PEZI|nr:hypothetical protein CBER1_11799 [Cercospora berteroae]